MSPDRPTVDPLRELLRRGDPAADGSHLAPEESARVRAATLARVRHRLALRRLTLAAAVAAAGVAATLILVPRREPPPPPAAIASPAAAGDSSPAPRQIRFATEKGTQIIWVLDPDLEL